MVNVNGTGCPAKMSKFCAPNFDDVLLNVTKYPIKLDEKILFGKTQNKLFGNKVQDYSDGS